MSNSNVNWEKHYKYYDFFQNQLPWYRKTIEFHVRAVDGKKRVLDTGAGSGNLSVELEKLGHSVVAIDSETKALGLLKEKSKTIQITVGDVKQLPFEDNSFDAVTSMFLLPFIYSVEKYFEEVYRVLKTDSIFSISAWSPEPDTFKHLKSIVETEFERLGVLPKHQSEWNELLITSTQTGKMVSNSKLDFEILSKLLNSTGFKDIKRHESAYGKYSIDITCSK